MLLATTKCTLALAGNNRSRVRGCERVNRDVIRRDFLREMSTQSVNKSTHRMSGDNINLKTANWRMTLTGALST